MKIKAISWLRVDPASRPGYVLLTHDWSILLTDGRWVLVRAGFWCDGASIPALARPWLSPLVLLGLGVAHDFACRVGASIHNEGGYQQAFTVESATDLAVAMAEHAGLGRVRRWAIRAALKLAASTYWHKRPMEWSPPWNLPRSSGW